MRVIEMTRLELINLFREVFDVSDDDTRYAAGAASLYAKVVAQIKNAGDPPVDRYETPAYKFVTEVEKGFHERSRFDFQPHPDFLEKIQELAGDTQITKLKIMEG